MDVPLCCLGLWASSATATSNTIHPKIAAESGYILRISRASAPATFSMADARSTFVLWS
jgi:hypothetical protein